MQKKILGICFLWFAAILLHAETKDATYRVCYGIFGQLGLSQAHLETHGDTYLIKVDAKTTGLVKKLSRNRQEAYLSRGHIVNGMLVSDTFDVQRSYAHKVTINRYLIDHKRKRVTKRVIKKKEGKILSDETKILDFYSMDDLLTLYFNLPKRQDFSTPGTYTLTAVGAEKQDGRVKIVVPNSHETKRYEHTLGRGDFQYLTAIVYQKIFESNKGELMLAIGKDGITQKAVLKDLILYGDLVAERIK